MSQIEFIEKNSSSFPSLLKEIADCPAGIYLRGDKNTLNDSSLKIAVVGTRQATPAGEAAARKLAKELAEQGVTVISGLALGIDQAAHQGCLEGGGRTIAVLAVGLDKIYPARHESLAERILANGGVLLSEYPAGSPILPYRFLERNRLISGLAKGVVIIEAPQQSGALVTAAHALDQNREVFVIPGAVDNKNYIGSNNLIKQGAALITSSEEILAAFLTYDAN